jgi:general stress protein YciG
MSSAANNPTNFANRGEEEVSEVGRNGGQSSQSVGFASTDRRSRYSNVSHRQYEIALKGGPASQETERRTILLEKK